MWLKPMFNQKDFVNNEMERNKCSIFKTFLLCCEVPLCLDCLIVISSRGKGYISVETDMQANNSILIKNQRFLDSEVFGTQN